MNEPLPNYAYANAGRRRAARRRRVDNHVAGLREELEAAHPEDRPVFLDKIRALLEES